MKFCGFNPLIIPVLAALAVAGCSQNTGARVTATAYDEPLTLLTGSNGMTLYVFDKDQGGESKCAGKCAVNWPPYIAEAGETKPEIWQTVQRADGTSQWTYDGKPVYFFKGDKAEGDTKGDGKDGVWHIIYRS
jgi:predicted lipoprotein with Yx(FWY)xxD motif